MISDQHEYKLEPFMLVEEIHMLNSTTVLVKEKYRTSSGVSSGKHNDRVPIRFKIFDLESLKEVRNGHNAEILMTWEDKNIRKINFEEMHDGSLK